MRRTLGVGIAGLLLTALCLALLPSPFLCLSLVWIGCCAVLVRRSRGRVRLAWYYLAVAFLLLATAETWAGISLLRRNEHFDRPLFPDYIRTDEVLGYAPVPGRRRRVRKYLYGETLYDVTYTIDENGLRAVPPDRPVDGPDGVLFFGGSYTYGEGVEDGETLPAVVQELARIRTFDFGFHGYGPHQMLAAIQSGKVEAAVTGTPRLAIYDALVSHLARAAGRSFWDRHGPRYLLEAGGRLVRRGHFDDEASPLRDAVMRQIGKSHVYERFLKTRIRVDADDIPLFLAIVGASRDALAARYPGIAFHVILWDCDATWGLRDRILAGLEARGIPWHAVSSVLPEMNRNPAKYRLHPHERHPSPAAYRAVGKYVVDHILPGCRRTGAPRDR
jgi:hypothetical protein